MWYRHRCCLSEKKRIKKSVFWILILLILIFVCFAWEGEFCIFYRPTFFKHDGRSEHLKSYNWVKNAWSKKSLSSVKTYHVTQKRQIILIRSHIIKKINPIHRNILCCACLFAALVARVIWINYLCGKTFCWHQTQFCRGGIDCHTSLASHTHATNYRFWTKWINRNPRYEFKFYDM